MSNLIESKWVWRVLFAWAIITIIQNPTSFWINIFAGIVVGIGAVRGWVE
jgi:hypothetical protein